jgi:MFS family permease
VVDVEPPIAERPPAPGRRRWAVFASLAQPNYRKFFVGQATSRIGTWMQTTAQGWLVLQLTDSGTALGLVVAFQTVPVLVLAPYGGLIADRVSRRRLLIWLESAMGLLALILGVLTALHRVRLWHVYVLALSLGVLTAFEMPARQTFVNDMVDRDHLRNAVSLNSVLNNTARSIGPGIAGILIGLGGTAVCFLLNALSYAVVTLFLVLMDESRFTAIVVTPRRRRQLREGFTYVRRTRALRVPLVMMMLIGCLAFEWQVSLPLIAKDTFSGGSRAYGFMTSAMGIGAVLGGLFAASRGRVGLRALSYSALLFASALVAASLAPSLTIELVLMVFVGAGSVTVSARGNTTLQLAAADTMRGRVMALFSVATMGTTPIGGPVVGAVAQYAGARFGLLAGALGAAGAGGLGLLAHRRDTTKTMDPLLIPAEQTTAEQTSAEQTTAEPVTGWPANPIDEEPLP